MLQFDSILVVRIAVKFAKHVFAHQIGPNMSSRKLAKRYYNHQKVLHQVHAVHREKKLAKKITKNVVSLLPQFSGYFNLVEMD